MKPDIEPRRIKSPQVERDSLLCIMEGEKDIPFPIQRVFHISGVQEGATRGNHAQKEMREVVFCIQGSVEISLDDARTIENFLLDKPNNGLLIEPHQWRILHNFSQDAILLVLASTHFDENDYIKDYQEFLETHKQ